jgi:hypothetical protein
MNNQMSYTLRFSLVIHDPSWTWVCTSFGYSWLKLNLSVYLIWLFMTQAEPECVAHLVIHEVHTQVQLESWITKWATHSGSAWVMNNQMSYKLMFSLRAEPECVAHLVIHDSSWTWVRSSFGYSCPKLNLSVYLIWLFMTQAEPECVAHSYTLRFSLSHE